MTDVAARTVATPRGDALILALASLAVVAINLQLWAFDTPPLVDWANHLARHVLQCGAAGAENVGRYYEYALRIVPNLTSELIHTLRPACANPELTQKMLIQTATLGLFAGALVLHRAIWGGWSVWPLLAALVMHNMAWAYGFENFVLAAPMPLLALAAWFARYDRPAALRLGVLWPVAGAIYVLHLYAFGFLMLALGCLEAQRAFDRRNEPGALRDAALSTVLLALIALGPALHVIAAIATSPEVEAGGMEYGGIRTLFMTILSPFGGYGHVLGSWQTASIAAALLAILAATPVLCRAAGLRVEIDSRVRLAIWPMLAVALVVPDDFSGVAFTNIRLPILLAPVLIAASRVRFAPRAGLGFAALVIALLAAKTAWIAREWETHDRQVAELRAAARVLGPEDRLIVLRAGLGPDVLGHFHSPAYILRDRGAYWWGLFTGGNSLSPRPAFAARDHTQPIPGPWQALLSPNPADPFFAESGPLHEWEAFYTHALLLHEPAAPAPDTRELGTTLARGSFFKIFALDTPAARARADGR